MFRHTKANRIISAILTLCLVISTIMFSSLAIRATGGEEVNVSFCNNEDVQTVEIEIGQTLSRPADPEKENYTFVGWFNGDEMWDFDNNVVMDEMFLTAKWAYNGITITFEDGGDIEPVLIMPGNTFEAPEDPIREKQYFTGWYTDESCETLWDFNNVANENMTLYAGWEEVSYTVYFDPANGETSYPVLVEHDTPVACPEDPEYEGYVFVGWFTEEDIEWDFSAPVTNTMTLYAGWEEAEEDFVPNLSMSLMAAPSAAPMSAPLLGASPKTTTVGFNTSSVGLPHTNSGFYFINSDYGKIITEIKWVTTPFTSSYVIKGSPYNIYVRYTSDNIMELYSEADVIYVTCAYQMFEGLKNCTRIDLSRFNFSNCINMYQMFYECRKLTSLDVSSFNTSNVTDMTWMFAYCESLTDLDLSSFNTAKVTSMKNMFAFCSKLTSLDVSSFNTANVTNMAGMFSCCERLTNLDLSNFNTVNVTDMSDMFHLCVKLTSLDISSFNTAKVTNMESMFHFCKVLTTLNLSNFNTANVTNMHEMFSDCQKLTELNLSSFNTAKVTDMSYMFYCCFALTDELDLSSFNTAKVTNMSYMFASCRGINTLDVSGFDFSSINKEANISNFVSGGIGLEKIIIKYNNPTYKLILTSYFYDNNEDNVSDYFISYKSWNYNISSQTKVNILRRWHNYYYIEFISDEENSSLTRYKHFNEGATLSESDIYIPTKENAIFNGWYTDKERTKPYVFNPVITSRITLYAKWSKECTVNFETNGGSTVTPIVVTSYNTISAPEPPTKEGVHFLGWYADETLLQKWNFATDRIMDDTTLYAKWGVGEAVLLPGLDFNVTIKSSITGNNEAYDYKDLSIKKILWSDTPFTSSTELQTADSDYPVYGKKEGSTYYIYSEAPLIYTNENCSYMFYRFDQLEELDITHFDTSRTTDMSYMFRGFSKVTYLDLHTLDTSNVTTMKGMFMWDNAFTEMDISRFDMSKVTDISEMFFQCSKLKTLNMVGLDIGSVTTTTDMFTKCPALEKIKFCANTSSGEITLNGSEFCIDDDENGYADNNSVYKKMIKSSEYHIYTKAVVVTIDPQNGTNTRILKVPHNGHFHAEDPIKDNCNFLGWYKDADCTEAWNYETDRVTSNITLYAGWEYLGPSVTFKYKTTGEDYTILKTEHLNNGDNIEKPTDPTWADHYVEGWYTDEDFTHKWDFDNDVVMEDTTLYLKWEIVTILLTGEQFNVKIKQLVKPELTSYSTKDTTIQHIIWVDTPFEADTELQESGKKVYARLNEDGVTVELYTEAEIVYLNKNSNRMFYKFDKLAELDLTQKYNSSLCTGFSNFITGENKYLWPDDDNDDVSDREIEGSSTGYRLSFNPSSKEDIIHKYKQFKYFLNFRKKEEPGTATDTTEWRGVWTNGEAREIVSVPEINGYSTNGFWYKNGQNTPFDFSQTISDSDISVSSNWISLYPHYTWLGYTITFANVPSGTFKQEINIGDTITRPEDPTLTNGSFVGWYADEGFTQAWDFNDIPESDITLYAKWNITSVVLDDGDYVNADIKKSTGVNQSVSSENNSIEFIRYQTEPFVSEKTIRINNNVIGAPKVYARYDAENKTVYINSPVETIYAESFFGHLLRNFTALKEADLTWITIDDAKCSLSGADPFDKNTPNIRRLRMPAYNEATTLSLDHEYYIDDDEDGVPDDETPITSIAQGTPAHTYITLNPYTVTFNTNGKEDIASVEAIVGSKISAPTTTRVCEGWFTDAEFTNEWDFDNDKVENDITLYAKLEDVVTILKPGTELNTIFKSLITEDCVDICFIEPWENCESSDNIAIDGSEPVYIRYIAGTGRTKVSHTPNIDDNNVQNGNYADYQRINDVVKIDGAASLHVKITYQTESSCDYVAIYKGEHSQSSLTSGYAYQYTGNKATREFDIEGDTVTFFFYSDSSVNNYGYYAEISSGEEGRIELYSQADNIKLNEDCSEMLKDIPISKLGFLNNVDVTNVKDMQEMFKNTGIENLDLSDFVIDSESQTTDMLVGCDDLTVLIMPENGSSEDITLPAEYVIDDDANGQRDQGTTYVTQINAGTEAHRYITRPEYIVTYNFNVNYGEKTATVKVKAGDKLTRPEDPVRGQRIFLSWKDKTGQYDYDFDTEVDSSFNLYANWKNYELTIIFEEGAANYFKPKYNGEEFRASIQEDMVSGDPLYRYYLTEICTIYYPHCTMKCYTDEERTQAFNDSVLLFDDTTLYARVEEKDLRIYNWLAYETFFSYAHSEEMTEATYNALCTEIVPRVIVNVSKQDTYPYCQQLIEDAESFLTVYENQIKREANKLQYIWPDNNFYIKGLYSVSADKVCDQNGRLDEDKLYNIILTGISGMVPLTETSTFEPYERLDDKYKNIGDVVVFPVYGMKKIPVTFDAGDGYFSYDEESDEYVTEKTMMAIDGETGKIIEWPEDPVYGDDDYEFVGWLIKDGKYGSDYRLYDPETDSLSLDTSGMPTLLAAWKDKTDSIEDEVRISFMDLSNKDIKITPNMTEEDFMSVMTPTQIADSEIEISTNIDYELTESDIAELLANVKDNDDQPISIADYMTEHDLYFGGIYSIKISSDYDYEIIDGNIKITNYQMSLDKLEKSQKLTADVFVFDENGYIKELKDGCSFVYLMLGNDYQLTVPDEITTTTTSFDIEFEDTENLSQLVVIEMDDYVAELDELGYRVSLYEDAGFLTPFTSAEFLTTDTKTIYVKTETTKDVPTVGTQSETLDFTISKGEAADRSDVLRNFLQGYLDWEAAYIMRMNG